MREIPPSELAQVAYSFEKGLRAAAGEHRIASLHLTRLNSIIGAPIAALAAVSGTAVLAQSSSTWKLAAGIISLVIAATTALASFFGFNKQADEHRQAASGYANLATEIELFRRQTENKNIPDDKDWEVLAMRIKERNKIRSAAPNITKYSKKRVDHKRIWNEEMTPPEAIWEKLISST
jgi:hypothetical protein